jgi:hypothetical protein
MEATHSELRISGLAFRLENIHFDGHKCIQQPVF